MGSWIESYVRTFQEPALRPTIWYFVDVTWLVIPGNCTRLVFVSLLVSTADICIFSYHGIAPVYKTVHTPMPHPFLASKRLPPLPRFLESGLTLPVFPRSPGVRRTRAEGGITKGGTLLFSPVLSCQECADNFDFTCQVVSFGVSAVCAPSSGRCVCLTEHFMRFVVFFLFLY